MPASQTASFHLVHNEQCAGSLALDVLGVGSGREVAIQQRERRIVVVAQMQQTVWRVGVVGEGHIARVLHIALRSCCLRKSECKDCALPLLIQRAMQHRAAQ